MKGMSGERISSHAPYGYIKGEGGKLLVDEETAPVVKLIFDLRVEGLGVGRIASELTRRNIPTPGTIEYRRTGKPAGISLTQNVCGVWRQSLCF